MTNQAQDVIEEVGALALAFRLKRLADQLLQDGIRVYQDAGVVFEPRWFPITLYLLRCGPTAVTESATDLGISHPAVNQVAGEMARAGLVAAYRDSNDKRRRLLALTSSGKSVVAITSRISRLCSSTPGPFIAMASW